MSENHKRYPTGLSHYPCYPNELKLLSALSRPCKIIVHIVEMSKNHYPLYPNELLLLSA